LEICCLAVFCYERWMYAAHTPGRRQTKSQQAHDAGLQVSRLRLEFLLNLTLLKFDVWHLYISPVFVYMGFSRDKAASGSRQSRLETGMFTSEDAHDRRITVLPEPCTNRGDEAHFLWPRALDASSHSTLPSPAARGNARPISLTSSPNAGETFRDCTRAFQTQYLLIDGILLKQILLNSLQSLVKSYTYSNVSFDRSYADQKTRESMRRSIIF